MLHDKIILINTGPRNGGNTPGGIWNNEDNAAQLTELAQCLTE